MSELENQETESTENVEEGSEVGKSLSEAITAYRKIREGKKELSEKELFEFAYKKHCNGGMWESRKFACSQKLNYVPNFSKTNK